MQTERARGSTVSSPSDQSLRTAPMYRPPAQPEGCLQYSSIPNRPKQPTTNKPFQSALSSTLTTIVSTFLVISLQLATPNASSEFLANSLSAHNKNSGHFQFSQLCPGKSQFPVTKRVEGAVLSSGADVDINCTITLQAKSLQHFVVRFEELKLGCDDHLKMFDGDLDYGQPSIKDFSCRDSLASVPIIKTTGSFLTLRFSSDSKALPSDGFRLVVTAVFDLMSWDCPVDYAVCSNRLCISRSLFCDDVNHCVDNSDELNCNSRHQLSGSAGSSLAGANWLSGELSLSNTLGLLVVLVLIIFTCVIIFISTVSCRRESHYARYQHHIQRAIGLPLQSSSSIMFANHHQPQYHYFQPANLSPYITPHHIPLAASNSATTATSLPRGYSTLPLNLARQQVPMQPVAIRAGPLPPIGTPIQQPTIISKAPSEMGHHHNEYLMMAGLTGPPTAAMQAVPTMQTSLYLPNSQSILATVRASPPSQDSRR